ncbi:protein ATP6V1FNB-like [Diachasma alloeum]|uniref:protein ATP6V1FNB-like n=1 Tax=Diachasma alloeum TaxID=454923 RepID=UPI00073817C4|nr:protein ATP6V1FNB-like [Diachasma alloeum]
MARGGACDALCQAFRKETIDNEDKLRMKWFIKNRSRLLQDLERDDEHIKEKLKKFKLESERWAAKPEPGEVEVENEVPASVRSHEDSDLTFMRPIDPSLLDILYDKKEVSHEARKKYLKERCKLAPEDRFLLMDCTNWSYGWKVKKFQTIPPKDFNRKPLIRTNFFRNNLSSIKHDDRPCCKKGLVMFAKNFKEIQEY